MRHELFPLDELPAGEMRSVMVGQVAIVVIHGTDGRLRALRDTCSHHGARLSRGLLQPLVVGDDVGDRQLSSKLVVRCPWHGFEFDVDTGRCPADPDRARVRAYAVTVEDGTVVLER
jgi:nitrite reductase (NADH) small subunit